MLYNSQVHLKLLPPAVSPRIADIGTIVRAVVMPGLPQEERPHSGRRHGRCCSINPRLHATTMRKALGLAAMIIVLGIFMPAVLNAIVGFLLVLFTKATAMLNALPASPADMHLMVQ